MKLFIIALLLTFNVAHAEIYKCETKDEQITYQQDPCTKAKFQKKIVVEKFDPEIIQQARKGLDKELLAFNEAEAKRIESEKQKNIEQPQVQVIEIHNETYKEVDRYHNRHYINDYYSPHYPTPYYQNGTTTTSINRNRRQHLNSTGALSRQSNMNPPSGR